MPANEQFWQMVEDELYSDFTIIVNDGENPTKEFKVHRVFLKHGSPVFRAMLENDMKEAKTGVCEIKDIKPEIMKLILRHIYGCKFDEYLDLENILDVITAADKYGIQSLISDSTKHIIENALNIRNCAKLLSYSGFLSILNGIKNNCYEVVKESAYELLGEGLNRDKFMVNISEDVLLEILDFDDINISSELEVIKFVEVWASNKVDATVGTFLHDVAIRNILEKNILSKIRFLTLTSAEFSEYFLSCGWLSSGERKLVLETIKLQTIPDNFPIYLPNSKTKRCLQRTVNGPKPEQSNEILVQLFDTTCYREHVEEDIKRCDFSFQSVNDGGKLIDFVFYSTYNSHDLIYNEPVVSVKITDEIGFMIDIIRLECNDNPPNGRFYLNYPLMLKKNEKYRMALVYTETKNTTIYCDKRRILQDISKNIKLSENGILGPITHLLLQ